MLLAVCPRLKGRKNVGKIYLFFLFDYLVAFNINPLNSDIARSTIISDDS
jgi:hypothetical protein